MGSEVLWSPAKPGFLDLIKGLIRPTFARRGSEVSEIKQRRAAGPLEVLRTLNTWAVSPGDL